MANIEKYIDNITVPSGNDTVTNYLVDTVSGYLKTIPYLTCTDTASTVAKTTTLISGVFTEDNLVAGAQVMVKFTNFNTATAPTLSVNGTTAKLIKRYGTQPPSTSAPTSWNNGSVVSFVYDGTYWQQVGFLNSTYSEISYDYITNGSGSFTGLISGRRAKTAVETFAPVKSVNGDTGDVVITVPTATSDLTNDSGFITGSEVPANETDPTVPSWAKASTKPSYTATEVGALPDDTFIPTKTSDLINDSDFMSGMTILLYGHSTWQDFITAYTKKHVVYCRASSQSNPATGSQTRLAFMAYVNNADSPTEVEFQYYRSVNTTFRVYNFSVLLMFKQTGALLNRTSYLFSKNRISSLLNLLFVLLFTRFSNISITKSLVSLDNNSLYFIFPSTFISKCCSRLIPIELL